MGIPLRIFTLALEVNTPKDFIIIFGYHKPNLN